METITDAARPAGARRNPPVSIAIAGGALVGYSILLTILSRLVQAGDLTREQALVWLACAGVAAGALYLAGLYGARGRCISPIWITVVAVAARLIVSASPPLLESDYQRYLWDGAVTASGLNPYRHAPGEITAGTIPDQTGRRLADLASRSGPVLESINHPHLSTIYPPVAQGAFAAAHAIAPFRPSGLRVVFCLADAATVLLLARLLRALSLPASQIAWLAWNPLLLREVYSSVHMDILVLPLIAGSLLAAVRGRAGLAAPLLVLAAAVKVWPIVLLPIVLRPLLGRWRRLAAVLAGCAALAAATWLPVLLAPLDEHSGFLAYGKGWQNNDGFFRAGIWVVERALTALSIEPWHSHTLMRLISAALLGGVVLWHARTTPRDGADIVRRGLWIVGAVFVLSPTQFPWYWLWCLPMLTLRPSLPLLLYTALLPLYSVQDQLPYPLAHWLQHAPVWGLLLLGGAGLIRARANSTIGAPEVGRA